MPRVPLEVALDSNSPSPFANLKSIGTCQLNDRAMRRSFSEGLTMSSQSEEYENHQDLIGSDVASPNKSFDAAFLDDETVADSIFRTDQRGRGVSQTTSWDGHEMNRSASGELSGRKHLRVVLQGEGESDPVAPRTIRKQQRTDNIPPKSENTKTPGRPRRSSGSKKSTPSSAARRRRTPRRQRLSPRLQQRRANSGVSPAPTGGKFPEAGATLLQSPVTPKTTLFGKPPPFGETPTRRTPLFPQTGKKAPKSRASFTGTTVSTSFDNSQKTTTNETASPTPFRFTSFPASLPRVNNPRMAGHGAYSTTKGAPAMDMESDLVEGDSSIKLSSRSQPATQNTSREDTHNSSLSSWSGEGGHLPPPAAPSFPPTVLEWKSPESEGALPAIETVLDDGERPRGGNSSVHTKLFTEEEHEQYGPSDEESQHSPSGSQVTRTRLNFNLVDRNANNNKQHNGHLLTEEGKVCLSSSESTTLFDASECEDKLEASTHSLSPNRPGHATGPFFSKEEIGLSPLSHQEEQFPFRMDAQCSPIPGIPDDDVPHQPILRSRASFPSSPCDMDVDVDPTKLSTRSRKSRPPLIPTSSPRKRSQGELNGQMDAERKGSFISENDESSHLSLSQESGESVSSTASSKLRRRPMPDMSAFDAGSSLRSSSTVNTTCDDSPGMKSDNMKSTSSNKLVCPPTPVRTPAWAQAVNGPHAPFTRSNSLIATKVLATCPIQVLDGHSSLESSLLDDDENEPAAFAPKFPAVYEGVEIHSDIHEMVSSDAPQPTKLSRHSSLPVASMPPPPPLVSRSSCSPHTLSRLGGSGETSCLSHKTPGPAKALTRLSSGFGEVGSLISFAEDFKNLGKLGSGTFADVFKVRSKLDNQLYAVKRNRRQFRGKRDRQMALAEVRTMQQLQSSCANSSGGTTGGKTNTKNVHSLFVLFFFQAWQEEGYFFCQTELCCRDTCRELLQSLRSDWPSASKKYPCLSRHLDTSEVKTENAEFNSVGRLTPEMTTWKICHDVAAGLSHVHSHRLVHYDIKLSNVFFFSNSRLGAICKIGDFGMAGAIGSSEDGQEGDTMYMAPELLASGVKHPSADIFSLGLSLYELASSVMWELPSEGPYWRELRSGSHTPELPSSRSTELSQLIQSMIHPVPDFRPTADDILEKVDKVKEIGTQCDPFLRDYVKDIEEYDHAEEQRLAMEQMEDDERGQTPRNASTTKRIFGFDSTGGLPTVDTPFAPPLFSPQADAKR